MEPPGRRVSLSPSKNGSLSPLIFRSLKTTRFVTSSEASDPQPRHTLLPAPIRRHRDAHELRGDGGALGAARRQSWSGRYGRTCDRAEVGASAMRHAECAHLRWIPSGLTRTHTRHTRTALRSDQPHPTATVRRRFRIINGVAALADRPLRRGAGPVRSSPVECSGVGVEASDSVSAVRASDRWCPGRPCTWSGISPDKLRAGASVRGGDHNTRLVTAIHRRLTTSDDNGGG